MLCGLAVFAMSEPRPAALTGREPVAELVDDRREGVPPSRSSRVAFRLLRNDSDICFIAFAPTAFAAGLFSLVPAGITTEDGLGVAAVFVGKEGPRGSPLVPVFFILNLELGRAVSAFPPDLWPLSEC